MTTADLPERLEQIFWECGAQFGIYLENLDTGEILQLDGDRQFSAAGTMKLAVLAALFGRIEEEELKPQMSVTVELDDADDCRGPLAVMRPPLQLTVCNLAVLMMVLDDDVAARNLVGLLGKQHLRERMHQWRLRDTVMRKEFDSLAVKDNAEDNLTTAENMGRLMAAICRSEICSRDSTEHMLGIMQRQRDGSEIFSFLPSGAEVAHKPGMEGMSFHDVAWVSSQNAEYVLSVFSTDVLDRQSGLQNLRKINRCVYEHCKH